MEHKGQNIAPIFPIKRYEMQKSQTQKEKAAFLVNEWLASFPSHAPSTREQLYDFVRAVHPDFSCRSETLSQAQKQLKESFEQDKLNHPNNLSHLYTAVTKVVYELKKESLQEAHAIYSATVDKLNNELVDIKIKLAREQKTSDSLREQLQQANTKIEQLSKQLECKEHSTTQY